jgi:hypothetical protein
MKEGLLWFDNDPKRTLDEKISRAATRYQVRFGRRPTTCYLNIQDFDDKCEEIVGLRVRSASNVQPHHFWIGVENEVAVAKAA